MKEETDIVVRCMGCWVEWLLEFDPSGCTCEDGGGEADEGRWVLLDEYGNML